MLRVTTEQVLSFRCRRSLLAGAGGSSLAETASQLLGAQAQVDTCAYHALALRTESRPPAKAVSQALHSEQRLVRTWGQRDTLHIYAKADWPLIVQASPLWVRSGRRGGVPPAGLVSEASQFFRQQARPLTRTDLLPLIPKSFVEELETHPGAQGSGGALRFAATRVIWTLAKSGHLVFGPRVGREVSYLHRDQVWEGRWPEFTAEEAMLILAERYFSLFGPATVYDLAHHFGANLGPARDWVSRLGKRLTICQHDERGELVLRQEDADELVSAGHQPIETRLLPDYDTALMAHRDKRWILPDAALEPLIWKKAAVVAATVLHRGRIVATWSAKKDKKNLLLKVTPLSGWEPGLEARLATEGQFLASHRGLEFQGIEVPAR